MLHIQYTIQVYKSPCGVPSELRQLSVAGGRVFDSHEGSSLILALFFLATQPQCRLDCFLDERKGIRHHYFA